MAAHPPPKPTEQTNPHETGTVTDNQQSAQRVERENRLHRNPREQGRQGNIKQNTTNEGYQQDR
jgi:hypothetical protein